MRSLHTCRRSFSQSRRGCGSRRLYRQRSRLPRRVRRRSLTRAAPRRSTSNSARRRWFLPPQSKCRRRRRSCSRWARQHNIVPSSRHRHCNSSPPRSRNRTCSSTRSPDSSRNSRWPSSARTGSMPRRFKFRLRLRLKRRQQLLKVLRRRTGK